MKKLSILLPLLLGIAQSYPLANISSDNNYCIGSWNTLGISSIPLIYEGEIVKISKGTFCTKLHKAFGNVGFLFVDVKYIQVETDGNNVNGLRLAPNTPEYEYYIASKVYANQLCTQISWHINQTVLPLKGGSSTLREIPLNTIIVPINSDYFQHDAKGILKFEIPVSDISSALLKLPNPLLINQSTKKLQYEIDKVYCTLPELKVMHSAQEKITRRADLVEVSMIR